MVRPHPAFRPGDAHRSVLEQPYLELRHDPGINCNLAVDATEDGGCGVVADARACNDNPAALVGEPPGFVGLGRFVGDDDRLTQRNSREAVAGQCYTLGASGWALFACPCDCHSDDKKAAEDCNSDSQELVTSALDG